MTRLTDAVQLCRYIQNQAFRWGNWEIAVHCERLALHRMRRYVADDELTPANLSTLATRLSDLHREPVAFEVVARNRYVVTRQLSCRDSGWWKSLEPHIADRDLDGITLRSMS